jgi:phasin
MEIDMSNETNSVLNSVQAAFAPISDAFKNLQNVEVPEAARDFVKRAAGTAKDRAADLHTGSEKVTAVIEAAANNSVSETAKISRSIQQAFYQDAEAFFNGIDKLASAKSITEAFQIQSDLVRAHGETLVARAKSTSEYVRQAGDRRCEVGSGEFLQGRGVLQQGCLISHVSTDRRRSSLSTIINLEGPHRGLFCLARCSPTMRRAQAGFISYSGRDCSNAAGS